MKKVSYFAFRKFIKRNKLFTSDIVDGQTNYINLDRPKQVVAKMVSENGNYSYYVSTLHQNQFVV